jgi:hypothetical protein
VIKALNDDMPFDRFTVEQIAGDMLPERHDRSVIASGFHRNTLLNQEGGIDVEEAVGNARRPRQHDGDGLARIDDRLRAVPQPQVRSVLAARLLPFARVLRQREYSVFGQQGGDHFIQEPTIDLPTPDQEKRRSTLAAELKTLEAG